METNGQAVAAEPAKKLNIQKEAVCLSLKLGMLRTRRRISTAQITTDADPTMVHVSKDILESDELKSVNRHHGDVQRYLRSRCLPSPFRSGVYLVKLALISEVLEQLEAYKRENEILVQRFMAFYQIIHDQRNDEKSQFREKLGTLYNADDYPEPKRVAQAFKYETQLWELSTPGALRTIDRALYEREAAKMQNVWEEARQTITQVLLGEFSELTKNMADRLTPSADGTQKVFRDSLVGNLQEWLNIFDKRALTDDAELVAMVQKARAMVAGIQPNLIRESDGLRADLARDMKALSQQIVDSIENRPGRVMDLDEEVAPV